MPAQESRPSHLWLAVVATLWSPLAPAQGWGGSILAASDYVLRGVSRSGGDPSLQADGHYTSPYGWLAGITGATVRRENRASTTLELDVYAGYEWATAIPWRLRATAIHYAYPFATPHGAYDYDELVATLGYFDRVFVTVSASPDANGSDTSDSYQRRAAYSGELALHWPLPHSFAANAGLGYYDRPGPGTTGYPYWNAGVSWQIQSFELDLSWIGAGERAQAAYDQNAEGRWVGSVLWNF